MTKEKKKNRAPASISKAELYDYLISHYVNAQESVFSDNNDAPAIYKLNVTISLPRSELTNIIKKDLIKKREEKWN